jgi:hypothetical protein
MNGTCGPGSGYRLIVISPAVGGAAGWAGDMVRVGPPPRCERKGRFLRLIPSALAVFPASRPPFPRAFRSFDCPVYDQTKPTARHD